MNDSSLLWSWGYGTLLLLASGFCAVLHLSCRQAGDAGIPRLMEKYPQTVRYERWLRRWDVCCAALLLCWMALAIGAVAFLVPALAAPSLPATAGRTLLLLIAVIVLVHIVPAALAESYSDRLTSALLPHVAVMTTLLYPLAYLVAGAERLLTRQLLSHSTESNRPSSEDEIISVVDDIHADDLEEDEREMIRSVLEFGETVAREIMTHRIDIVAFECEETVAACVEKSKQSYFSRFPVYAGSLDDVRGVVHVKDLLRSLSEGQGEAPIAQLCHKVTFAPESMPIDDLFRLLCSVRAQIALVVDEYGGTAGLVSVEDIIEELVGEIHDEYDATEARIQKLQDGSYLVDARVPVYEINEAIGIDIPEHDDYDSLGGFIFHQMGLIPAPGARLPLDKGEIRVQTAVPNRIVTARVIFHPVDGG